MLKQLASETIGDSPATMSLLNAARDLRLKGQFQQHRREISNIAAAAGVYHVCVRARVCVHRSTIGSDHHETQTKTSLPLPPSWRLEQLEQLRQPKESSSPAAGKRTRRIQGQAQC